MTTYAPKPGIRPPEEKGSDAKRPRPKHKDWAKRRRQTRQADRKSKFKEMLAGWKAKKAEQKEKVAKKGEETGSTKRRADAKEKRDAHRANKDRLKAFRKRRTSRRKAGRFNKVRNRLRGILKARRK